MSFLRTYLRVLGLLHTDARLAVTLALANIVLAGAQFVEPVLFGRIIDALSGTLPAGLGAAAHALARSDRCAGGGSPSASSASLPARWSPGSPTAWRIAAATWCWRISSSTSCNSPSPIIPARIPGGR